MDVVELAPGLRRWTAPHLDWVAGVAAGSPDDCGEESFFIAE